MSQFFSEHYRRFLWGIFFLSLILFIIAIVQISDGNITGFQPLFFGFGFLLFGAFNWADIFIFSLLWIILSFILLRIQKGIYFFLAYFSFWFIRSSGEVLFSVLQQFHPQTRPWLMYLPRAVMQQSILGKFILVRYWVVEQTFFQSIAVLSLFGLIYTGMKLFKNK